jgi:hypothetical protein
MRDTSQLDAALPHAAAPNKCWLPSAPLQWSHTPAPTARPLHACLPVAASSSAGPPIASSIESAHENQQVQQTQQEQQAQQGFKAQQEGHAGWHRGMGGGSKQLSVHAATQGACSHAQLATPLIQPTWWPPRYPTTPASAPPPGTATSAPCPSNWTCTARSRPSALYTTPACAAQQEGRPTEEGTPLMGEAARVRNGHRKSRQSRQAEADGIHDGWALTKTGSCSPAAGGVGGKRWCCSRRRPPGSFHPISSLHTAAGRTAVWPDGKVWRRVAMAPD